MYLLFSILILIACILLILIVLVQNSKGGGLASNFSASNQVMGVKKTADFLEKATWSLAIALVVLSLAATFALPRPNQGVERTSRAQELLPANQMPANIATQQEEPTTPVED
jgi:preprotein translocase subunit SecG